MRLRAALATSIVVGASLAAVADAAPAPKKACNLVTDAKGDVDNSIEGPAQFPADDGLDLLGADVATNGKNVTAVIRLVNQPGSATLYAKRYILQFNAVGAKNPVALAVAITPTGTSYSWGYYGTTTTGTGYTYPGTATGKISETTITVSAALADLAANENIGAIKHGAKISSIQVTSNRRVPSLAQVTGSLFQADIATGKTAYYAGSPSCIAV